MEEREEEKMDRPELKMVAAEDTEEGKKRQSAQQENVRKPKSVGSEVEKGTRQAARGADRTQPHENAFMGLCPFHELHTRWHNINHPLLLM